MAGGVKHIEDDAQFQTELTNAGSKLVVVDFFATWCGPCQRIAPFVEQLATKYPNAVFLKVDVDQCSETAASNGVTAMPTFLFFRNKAKIDTQRGAEQNALEDKIKKWYGSGEEESEETGVKGHMDLNSMIDKSGCECLNESDEHTLEHGLTSKGGYLESDCDEQLIISIAFTQTVKLHSLKFHGPPALMSNYGVKLLRRLLPPSQTDKGPKTVKVFINQPRTLDFDQAESMEPIQTLELKPEDVQPGAITPLRFVKYQNVNSLTIFVKDNQGDEETTQIDYLGIIGSPRTVTNMADFKRVAGKKGESE